MSCAASVQTFGNKSTQNLVINLFIISQIGVSVKLLGIFLNRFYKKTKPRKIGALP